MLDWLPERWASLRYLAADATALLPKLDDDNILHAFAATT
jgi:hypothetical protein